MEPAIERPTVAVKSGRPRVLTVSVTAALFIGALVETGRDVLHAFTWGGLLRALAKHFLVAIVVWPLAMVVALVVMSLREDRWDSQ